MVLCSSLGTFFAELPDHLLIDALGRDGVTEAGHQRPCCGCPEPLALPQGEAATGRTCLETNLGDEVSTCGFPKNTAN
eukprot:2217658-Amphidinium_carterae.1